MDQQHASRKSKVIARLYNTCKSRNSFVFSNDEVKAACSVVGFANQFDATKFDSTLKLPDVLAENNVFVVHIGGGNHKFVQGIDIGYHKFEPINDTYQWYYRPGILDNINTSESNILSVGFNQRIIHDFLYRDITASPKVYGSHRTSVELNYKIGNDTITSKRTQIEIDLTTEFQGRITIFEAKNGNPHDFNVFQLFNPYRYYKNTINNPHVHSIECCYLLRDHCDKMRLYLYSFTDTNDPSSIELKRNAEYTLVTR